MANYSAITHPANYHYVTVGEDYLAICSFGEASPHCKAIILSILEGWANTRLASDQDIFVHLSLPQWIAQTYEIYARNTIISCLQELLEKKFIERREIVFNDQKTFEYKLNIELIQKLLKGLPPKVLKPSLPDLNTYHAYVQYRKEQRQEEGSLKINGVQKSTTSSSKGSLKINDGHLKTNPAYPSNLSSSNLSSKDVKNDETAASGNLLSQDSPTNFSLFSESVEDYTQEETTEPDHTSYSPDKTKPAPLQSVENERPSMQQRASSTPKNQSAKAEPASAVQAELNPRPTIPVMPAVSDPLTPQKLVAINDALNGKYCSHDQKSRSLKAAKKIISTGITAEEYVLACQDTLTWWNSPKYHKGLLHTTDMAVTTDRGQMRALEVRDRMQARKEVPVTAPKPEPVKSIRPERFNAAALEKRSVWS